MAKHIVSKTQPEFANLGDEWFDPGNNKLYRFVLRDNEFVWVENLTAIQYRARTITTAVTANVTKIPIGRSSSINSLSLNTDTNTLEFYDGSNRSNVALLDYSLSATGGIVTETTSHYIHTFNSSNTFTILRNAIGKNPSRLEMLVVAGGGAGGATPAQNASPAGGGGGGGVLYSSIELQPGSYTVVVGAGGATNGPSLTDARNPGSNSYVSIFPTANLLAIGGGGGGLALGSATANIHGGNGGSGGGGGAHSGTTRGNSGNGFSDGYVLFKPSDPGWAIGTVAIYGFPGGNAAIADNNGGGGGGAGRHGANAHTFAVPQIGGVGGFGGDGIQSDISGTIRFYGGGGGGASSARPYLHRGSLGGGSSFQGPGTTPTDLTIRNGGAGDGGVSYGPLAPVHPVIAATSGAVNSGGGGGASAVLGAGGGSGVVMIRYLKGTAQGSYLQATSTGPGANTILMENSAYHVFTNPGTFEVTRAGYANILLVGGGGAGGSNFPTSPLGAPGGGGGGGGGGVIEIIGRYLETGIYDITTGHGGRHGAPAGNDCGGNTIMGYRNQTNLLFLANLIAFGGGAGSPQGVERNSGGSSGGASTNEPLDEFRFRALQKYRGNVANVFGNVINTSVPIAYNRYSNYYGYGESGGRFPRPAPGTPGVPGGGGGGATEAGQTGVASAFGGQGKIVFWIPAAVGAAGGFGDIQGGFAPHAYFGGGGGGGRGSPTSPVPYGAGGTGGGGIGAPADQPIPPSLPAGAPASNAIINTGGGGGGGSPLGSGTGFIGGNGANGVVVIQFQI